MQQQIGFTKLYTDILDLLPGGVMIIDRNGAILFVNRASEQFNQVDREKLIGRKIVDLQKENFFKPAASLLTLKSGKVESVIQNLRNKKKLLVFSYPIFDDSGNILYVITLSTDVTEQLRLQQQLEEKERIIQLYSERFSLHISDEEKRLTFHSKEMEKVHSLISKTASTDINILLTGESGVGKTFWAKQIHNLSSRANEAFVTINCSTIPESLLESELFGYESGAFTGALSKGKIGLFETANRGTIFLDEIGELPHHVQIKLLQVLQDREIRRIGGSKSIPVDFRLITATNQDLQNMIKEKTFREDLYYRLNGFSIHIPALRERPEDIVPLSIFFLKQYNQTHNDIKKLSHDTLHIFQQYPWPGNIRELEHVLESACVISEYEMITYEDLPDNFRHLNPSYNLNIFDKKKPSLQEALEIVEADLVRKAYEKTKTSYGVAEQLKISQATAWRKIQKYCDNVDIQM